jgi:hypothetical protein
MALKHWQDGFVGEGSHLYLHALTHSARALTDGAAKAASTSKIVSDLAGVSLARRPITMRPPRWRPHRRASFSAALHQAAGGWRPAPLHFWPKGRRPCRESPRRYPDPWWPLQT